MATIAARGDETVADEYREEFADILYHITHDLRACLRALKTVPSWIKADLAETGTKLPEMQLEMLDLMITQALRGDRILIDLLTYSRIGRLSDPKSWISLSSVVEEAMQQYGVPPAYTVSVALDRDKAFGSQNDMTTLFTALISNAVKHHEKDGGSIKITSREAQNGVEVIVEDDGPGIAPEHRERVFELMSTLKPRDEVEGSGVGLALVRKIVSQTKGTVRIAETRGDKGTAIEVYLPDPVAPRPVI